MCLLVVLCFRKLILLQFLGLVVIVFFSCLCVCICGCVRGQAVAYCVLKCAKKSAKKNHIIYDVILFCFVFFSSFSYVAVKLCVCATMF
jgi:hypothetical protein